MKRYCFLIVALLFFVYAAQACRRSNTSIGGGETNWLKKCASDADCSEGILCECGICTKSCENSDACTEVRGASSCLVTESLDDGTCRVAAAGESEQGICVARCETDSDCNQDSDFKCIIGICTAVIEENSSGSGDAGTTYGLIFPNSDAGRSFPLGLNETADANRSAYDSSTEHDESDSAVEGTDATDSSSLGPAMENHLPHCPCTVDVEQGFRAHTLEDYSRNRYGGPESEKGNEFPCVLDFGYIRYLNPHDTEQFEDSRFPDDQVDDSRFQGLLDLCLFFSLCSRDCETDDDCPTVDSGTAVARCVSSANRGCYLDCDSNRTCPDGMTCIHGVDGASCFWAQDQAIPGCPAYCEQYPVPRDCPNFCASGFVACDPDKGVSCCEGLVCVEEGYCVPE